MVSNIPIPDPTTLTIEALQRAVTAERAYVDGEVARLVERIDGLRALLEQADREHARLDLTQFQAQKEAVAAALAAVDRTTQKAETATDHRFEAVETLRAQLSALQQTVMLRGEYTMQHTVLTDRIAAIENLLRTEQGRSSGIQSGWAYLVGAIGALAGLVGLIIAFRG